MATGPNKTAAQALEGSTSGDVWLFKQASPSWRVEVEARSAPGALR